MNALLPLFAAPAIGDHTGRQRPGRRPRPDAAAQSLAPAGPASLVANVMTTTFGGSDAEGAWLWRDAYDAIEAALVLQIRRLAPQIGRLEDAPAEIVALLANLAELSLTHTRRSEEQVALDQFSTPPQLGALAVLAAQVRPGDQVLEPSAGTGLLAILAEACGGAPHPQRAGGRPRGPAGRPVPRRGPQPARRRAPARHPAGVGRVPRRARQSAVPAARGAPARRPGLPGRRRPAVGDRAGPAVRGCARRCGRSRPAAASSCAWPSRPAPTPSTGPPSRPACW